MGDQLGDLGGDPHNGLRVADVDDELQCASCVRLLTIY
jgi:hypothetical protein